MYEKILDIAEQLFMTQGYQATSTRQITEILDVTQPTIYYYFKKKEELYYQVMLRLSKNVEKNLREIAARPDCDMETKLSKMVEYLKTKHPFNLFVMMHDIQNTLSKDISKKLYHLFLTSYQQPFVQLLEANQGKLRDALNSRFAVSQLFVLIAAYLNASDKEEDFSKAMDLFLRGIY